MEEKTLEDYRIERETKVLDAIKNGTLSSLVDNEGYGWDMDFLITILGELAYYTKENAKSNYVDIAYATCDALVEYKGFGKTDAELDEM